MRLASRALFFGLSLAYCIILIDCGSSTSHPPTFALTVSPGDLSLMQNGLPKQVSIGVTGVNGFSSPVAVTIGQLPSGVTSDISNLSLSPGETKLITFRASATARVAGSTMVLSGVSGTLTNTSPVALYVEPVERPAPTAQDITTYHNDNMRDGLNSKETALTVFNVNPNFFGKIGFDMVDGKVDAQPLFISNLSIGGRSRNVLYVATEHDSIYAFDADSGAQLWQASVLGQNEKPSDNHNANAISPEIGITATPVIDRSQGSNGTLFVIAMSEDMSGGYHQRIHAIDLIKGAELSDSPAEITGVFPGTGDNSENGIVIFDPAQYAARTALLLLDGTIYFGWTSHLDQRPYTGWVMGYSEANLQQTQILNLTPNGYGGAVWMSGNGLSADPAGNMYLLNANGTFDVTLDSNGNPASGDYGNAALKLTLASGKLIVKDYFTSRDTLAETDLDHDLGSSGAVLLPDLQDTNGKTRHLLIAAGKGGRIYIIDRDQMGKYDPDGDDSNVYQEIDSAFVAGCWSSEAVFNGTVYFGPALEQLQAFPVANAKLATYPSSRSTESFGYPGATPSISANGKTDGIVWAVEAVNGYLAVLHAYDATDLSHELYNSTQAANDRDALGVNNKFMVPLIVNGKVYVGTPNGVAIYGLLTN